MTKSILIVEDDLKAAKTAENFFSANYNVSVAHDLKEALDFLKNHIFDYVITDTFYPQEIETGKREYLQYIISSIEKRIRFSMEMGELRSDILPKVVKSLELWTTGGERDQPLGLFLAKILLENYGFSTEQIVFTTNLNHHAESFEAIHCLRVGSNKLPPAFANIDIVDRSKNTRWPVLVEGVGDSDCKYKESFWRRLQDWLK